MTEAEIRHRMMGWLARREYGFVELTRKAVRELSIDESVAELCVQVLTDANLQSDERFLESFCRSRVNKGQGPLKIKSELSQRGISRGEIQTAMEELDVNWETLAREKLGKRFGETPIDSPKEKARRARFLAGQGYPEGLVLQLLNE